MLPVDPAVATPVADELQVPPVVPELRVTAEPTHMAVTPVSALGKGFTVKVVTLLQPPSAYVIVVAPAATPVTVPVTEPTVATATVLLLHTPPVVAELSVVADPAHTLVVPVIAAGIALTVTVVVVLQPDVSVKVIEVVPAETPVTIPELLIVATAGVLLVHDSPPVDASLKPMVVPTHKEVVPVIASGNGFTVTEAVL